MKKINSRAKGCRGERQVRDLFRDHGYLARRGQQYSGTPDSPDVVVMDLPWIYVEVKLRQRADIVKWYAVTTGDCGSQLPVLFYRKNNTPWRVVISRDDRDILESAGEDWAAEDIDQTEWRTVENLVDMPYEDFFAILSLSSLSFLTEHYCDTSEPS